MLELRNIEKYYNPGTINEMCLFDKFNLTVDKGEFVSVVGSNGSGKTSMLNILCGSIPVDGGQILMNGEDITTKKEFKRNQKIGRVYQNPAMGTCPTMTILENMSLADNKGKFFGLSSGINKELWYLCRVNKTGNKKKICLNIAFIWMIVRISTSF